MQICARHTASTVLIRGNSFLVRPAAAQNSMHKYVRLNRAARVCVCVRADVCAVCSFVDARVQVGVCGTFDMSRDFVTTSGPDKKHKQQQHPRHHSAATDGTRRPPLVRDGNTPARSGRVGTGSHASDFRTVSFTVGVSVSRSLARARSLSLSPLAVSLRWVSFFLVFFPPNTRTARTTLKSSEVANACTDRR